MDSNIIFTIIGGLVALIVGGILGVIFNKFWEGKFDAKPKTTEEDTLNQEWKDQQKGYK